MSFLQQFGFSRCSPMHQYHSLLTAFTPPRDVRFCSALQQYVDSFNAIEIDEHWLSLRDRYKGQEWTCDGVLKTFEDSAYNSIGLRLQFEWLTDHKRMPTIQKWKSLTVFGFRHHEISTHYPEWLTTPPDGRIKVNTLLVPVGSFEVLAQFQFLRIAGAVKSRETKYLFDSLGVREGR